MQRGWDVQNPTLKWAAWVDGEGIRICHASLKFKHSKDYFW